MHQYVLLLCGRELNKDTKMRFTYTAMHGVGYRFVQQVFCEFEIPEVIPVKEQVSLLSLLSLFYLFLFPFFSSVLVTFVHSLF